MKTSRGFPSGFKATALAPWILASLSLVGCKAPPEKTGFESEIMIAESSPLVLWAEVFNYLEVFSKRVEKAADQIMEQTEIPEVRRRALLWKMNAIPVCLSVQDHPSPVGCLLDAWALTRQMRQYYDEGHGASAFGELQPLAISTCADLEGRIIDIARAHLQPRQFRDWEQKMAEWTAEHVISDHSFDRPSGIRTLAAGLAQKAGSDLFATVENLETEVYLIRAKVGLYADYLPRQARWQAERLAMDALDNQVTPLLTNAFERVGVERRAALEDVDRQRLETLNLLQAEREIILQALRGERRVILEEVTQLTDEVMGRIDVLANALSSNLVVQVQEQRLETLEFVQQERMATTQDMDEIARGALDEGFRRLWLVLAAVWIGLAGLLLVARWLFGRRTEPRHTVESHARHG